MREDIKREVRDLAFENAIAKASRPQKPEKKHEVVKKAPRTYQVVPSKVVKERFLNCFARFMRLQHIADPPKRLPSGADIVTAKEVKEWVAAAKAAQEEMASAINLATQECFVLAPDAVPSHARCTLGLLHPPTEIPF